MPIVILEHTCISRANRLSDVLTRYGHRLDHRRVHKGDPIPTNVDGMDGLVIMGSPDRLTDGSAAHADAEMDLARLAHEAGLPVLGICFGAQVLAQSLGGTLGPLEGGVRVGMHDITLTPAGRDDPLLAGLPWTMSCLHWNRDVATSLPPDAVLLASGPASDVQAWRLGTRTYAVQFHPEMHPGVIDAIISEDRPDLDEAGTDGPTVRAQVAQAWPTYERLSERLMANVAMLLMPLDQRTLDVVRDLHH
ncbi:MAG: type 1 glutamine amidotransferase [Phycisphaerales bacterium]|nr:type 1 glutamine amidotransferase [Phycisphaerales bacterium]